MFKRLSGFAVRKHGIKGRQRLSIGAAILAVALTSGSYILYNHFGRAAATQVVVSGLVYNRDTGGRYANVTVFFCGNNGTAVTDGNGYFSRTFLQGTQYCVRVYSGGPANVNGPTAPNNNPTIGPNQASYEYQYAGNNCYQAFLCTAQLQQWDRNYPTDTADSGMNFMYTDKPTGPALTVKPDSTYNAYFTRYGPGWTGADGATSSLLPDGRVAWSFSDTFLGTVNADRSRQPQGMIRNSMMVQGPSGSFVTLAGGTSAQPSSLIPDVNGRFYWVGDSVVEGNYLRQLVCLMETPAGGGFAFTGQVSVASFSLPDMTLRGVTPVINGGSSMPMWGGSILEEPDYDYIYTDSKVARVPKGQITNAVAWRFYQGNGVWLTDPNGAVRIARGGSDSVVKRSGGYVMFSIPTWGDYLEVSYALDPLGPWSDPYGFYKMPQVGNGEYAYGLVAHPEFDSQGQLLLSYNTNNFDFNALFTNADNYRPWFVRVNLPPGVVADVNNDGKVNTLDLSALLSKWGTNDQASDINHDGKVNILDLSALLAHWTG